MTTESTNHEESPRNSIPMPSPVWMVTFTILALVLIVANFMYFSPFNALIHTFIIVLTLMLCYAIWFAPSRAHHLEFHEFLIVILIFLMGGITFITPEVRTRVIPLMNRMGIDLLAPPTTDMWSVDGEVIRATGKVPSGQQLVVEQGERKAFLGSFKLAEGDAQVFLQETSTGRTSSAVSVR